MREHLSLHQRHQPSTTEYKPTVKRRNVLRAESGYVAWGDSSYDSTLSPPESLKGFFRVGESAERYSTLCLHSPCTAALYNERFEPQRRREARNNQPLIQQFVEEVIRWVSESVNLSASSL